MAFSMYVMVYSSNSLNEDIIIIYLVCIFLFISLIVYVNWLARIICIKSNYIYILLIIKSLNIKVYSNVCISIFEFLLFK